MFRKKLHMDIYISEVLIWLQKIAAINSLYSIFFGLLLKPGPRPWTRSLDPNPKNLDPEKPGP